MDLLTTDWLAQKVIQSSLMLGFAVAILVALIAMRDTRKRTTVTIVIFTFAAFMLLIDNYSVIRLSTEFAGLPQPIDSALLAQYTELYEGVKWIGTLGFLLLILGIGCTGWIHSKLVGVLSTLGALVAILFIFGFVWSLIGIERSRSASPASTDDARVYEGYYYYSGSGSNAEPVSSFVPCEANEQPGPGKGTWLVTNDHFDEMYKPEADRMTEAIMGTLPPGGEFGMYIKFKGIAAPPSAKGYGYQNQYQEQITVTEPLQMKYFIVPWDVDLCKSK
ncbi:MAG TPA: hypothetical protein VHP14_19710 [Anaerolineales bacterium]|nr:hypothetical protein [Anaerolineales bacterium]